MLEKSGTKSCSYERGWSVEPKEEVKPFYEVPLAQFKQRYLSKGFCVKRIIGKRVYNTDTAQKLGHSSLAMVGGDTCSEALYRQSRRRDTRSWRLNQQVRTASRRTGGSLASILSLCHQRRRAWAKMAIPSEYEGGRQTMMVVGDPQSVCPCERENKLILLREKTGKSISQIVLELVNTLD